MSVVGSDGRVLLCLFLQIDQVDSLQYSEQMEINRNDVKHNDRCRSQ